MENRSDIEKRLGEKLEAAYMLEETPQGMSREDFHRLIQAAEKKKKRRRNMLSLAAACVALCLVCGGFVAGMTLGESATAGKDGEKKTVQQGDSVVIGSGVGENDENVGVSTKTYASIEDIPEDIRKEIHFLDSDEFELEKVKVVVGDRNKVASMQYVNRKGETIEITEKVLLDGSNDRMVMNDISDIKQYKGKDIYIKNENIKEWYYFRNQNIEFAISLNKEQQINIEVILNDLLV